MRIHEGIDLEALMKSSRFRKNRFLIIGGGCNFLLSEEQYNGVVLKNEIKGVEVVSQDGTHTVLHVGGGIEWSSLVACCNEMAIQALAARIIAVSQSSRAPW